MGVVRWEYIFLPESSGTYSVLHQIVEICKKETFQKSFFEQTKKKTIFSAIFFLIVNFSVKKSKTLSGRTIHLVSSVTHCFFPFSIFGAVLLITHACLSPQIEFFNTFFCHYNSILGPISVTLGVLRFEG